MLRAYRNPIRVFDLGDLVMLIGADQNGRLLEMGVAEGEGVELLSMPCPSDRSS